MAAVVVVFCARPIAPSLQLTTQPNMKAIPGLWRVRDALVSPKTEALARRSRSNIPQPCFWSTVMVARCLAAPRQQLVLQPRQQLEAAMKQQELDSPQQGVSSEAV